MIGALPTGPAAGAAYLALILAPFLLGALISARIWPWRWCWRCKGKAKLWSPLQRGWRDCPRCSGTGVGRRIGSGR